jgi:hypothetical protein
MRERYIGIAALTALLWVAYNASAQTTASWGGTVASAASSATASDAGVPRPISDAEAVVGRPHDGIRALPARRVERVGRP